MRHYPPRPWLDGAVMHTIRDWLSSRRLRLSEDEEGQGLIEYALILALIALVVITILGVLGLRVNTLYSNVSNSLSR